MVWFHTVSIGYDYRYQDTSFEVSDERMSYIHCHHNKENMTTFVLNILKTKRLEEAKGQIQKINGKVRLCIKALNAAVKEIDLKYGSEMNIAEQLSDHFKERKLLDLTNAYNSARSSLLRSIEYDKQTLTVLDNALIQCEQALIKSAM